MKPQYEGQKVCEGHDGWFKRLTKVIILANYQRGAAAETDTVCFGDQATRPEHTSSIKVNQ